MQVPDRERSRRETVEEQLRRLAEEQYRSIYNLIYSYLGGDPEEAEDLTLQTFENAFASFHKFRGDADVKTWLFRIAINVCKNRIRHLQIRRKYEAFALDQPVGADDEEATTFDVPDTTFSPEEVATNRELTKVLRDGIRSLPDDYREVLLLKLEDFSYKEIAEMLGCTVETVKSRLFRARSALKQKVRHYLDVDEKRQRRSRAEKDELEQDHEQC